MRVSVSNLRVICLDHQIFCYLINYCSLGVASLESDPITNKDGLDEWAPHRVIYIIQLKNLTWPCLSTISVLKVDAAKVVR